MVNYWNRWFLLALLALIAAAILRTHHSVAQSSASAEAKAIAFLQREVPAWKQTNDCFSCHNNGDAARALFAAQRKGFPVAAEAMADTIQWVSAPHRWEQNKGDPGFSDKRLANLQFAASLLAAVEAGLVKDLAPLQQATRKVMADQSTDGSWKMDAGNTIGSPATWGSPLATWMALRVLQKADLVEANAARQKAEQALAQMKPNNVLTTATLLLALPKQAAKREEYLQWLQRAQTRDGGWGPYPDSPPECFDTALVLLALAKERAQQNVKAAIQRGRAFLIAQQNADGSWPATTRPSGGDSYAQMMSTTGWVTLALLETKE